MEVYDIAIIGGGPAGMMAGVAAGGNNAGNKNRVCLLEKNKTLGVKLLLTGKGRCNLTTSKTIHEIIKAFGQRGAFFYSALSRFSNIDLMDFFKARGVTLKEERGQRIFPANDKAVSILSALKTDLLKKGTEIIYEFKTVKIEKQESSFKIYNDKGQAILAKRLILATGGKSYPETGSTGEGYQFAKSFGHRILPLKPALAPLYVKDEEIRQLAGLDLDNVNLTVRIDNQLKEAAFGDLIFTHQGISGPIVFQLTTKIYDLLRNKKEVWVSIDLKPALDLESLQKRINREVISLAKKEYQSLLAELLPKSLISYATKQTQIEKHKRNGNLTREEKDRLAQFLKNFTFKIDGVAPIEEGIVTAGGIEIDEIDQRTMESKIVEGLYFAGEIIGLDGPTGGFNLTKAFCTGWLAGKSASSA